MRSNLTHETLDAGQFRTYSLNMTTTNNGLQTTYPYSTSPGVARHQCVECGAWERSDKAGGSLRHSKRCDSRPQPESVAQLEAQRAVEIRRSDLEKFARNVRRTGMTNGRDQDVLEAVRAGLLSESDAMNTDD